MNKELEELENQWYERLKQGKPDYSVYSHLIYIKELEYCYKEYSKKYLKAIEKNIHLFKNVKSIIDLGCGIGLTTKTLKEIFPDSIVYGTNIKDTEQYKLAKKLSKEHNFNIIPSINSINSIDFVFASEYFEHILTPIKHIIDIINKLKPNYIITANAFNAHATGHFNEYKHRNKVYDKTKIGRLFNNTLRKYNYIQIKTKFWNNRPMCWKINRKNNIL